LLETQIVRRLDSVMLSGTVLGIPGRVYPHLKIIVAWHSSGITVMGELIEGVTEFLVRPVTRGS
jgi:hypothetical protein